MVAWGDEETRRSERDEILRGIKKFFRGDWHIHYLDLVNGFMDT